MTELQSNLIDFRREKKLTQKEVADKIGVSASAIGFWETGKNEPKVTYLIKLANFFEITVDELVGYNKPSLEEQAAGATPTRRIILTPIEDEMLYIFREIGKKHGIKSQRALITVAENMVN